MGEPRRSGRATKGQHTKNLDLDEPAPAAPKREKKTKGKTGKTSKNATSEEPEEEVEEEDEEGDDDSIIRCVCGATADDDGWMMICCENCDTWQHNLCMDVPEDEASAPEHYYCENCRPEDHKELLAAMAKGEKPWEVRIAERKAQEKKKKGKKGGRGKSARTSTAAESEPAGTPKAASSQKSPTPDKGTKRKFEAVEPSNGTSNKAAPAATAQQDSTPASKTATPTTPAFDGRRSSGANEHPVKRAKSTSDRKESIALGSPIPPPEGFDKLAKDRQPAVKTLTAELKKTVQSAVKDGSYTIPPNESTDSVAQKLALTIENTLHYRLKDKKKYGDQVRSIFFNMKKNPALGQRMLNGALTPEELATMSSDDMASDDVQKERAAMKVDAEKHSVLLHEEVKPRYRRTHKGDELVEDNQVKNTEISYQAPVRRPTIDHSNSETNVDRSGAHFDTGSPPPDAQDAFDRPEGAEVKAEQDGAAAGTQSKARKASNQRDAADDTDFDSILKPEETAAPTSSEPTVWRGRVQMNGPRGYTSFTASARYAAGGDVGHKVPYTDLVKSTIEIDGRISPTTCNKYIGDMRFSQTMDVCSLSIIPANTAEDREAFQYVYNYLNQRQRWGVVANHAGEPVRDVYAVLLDKGGPEKMPGFLTMLEQSVIEQNRSEDTLLLTLIVRTKTIPMANTPATPGMQNNPGFSPVVNAGPGSNTPQQPAASVTPSPYAAGYPIHSQPQPAISNLAAQILGPFVSAPVVLQIIASVGDMTEVQLQNLRDILERYPDARADLGKLSEHLAGRIAEQQSTGVPA